MLATGMHFAKNYEPWILPCSFVAAVLFSPPKNMGSIFLRTWIHVVCKVSSPSVPCLALANHSFGSGSGGGAQYGTQVLVHDCD